MRARFALLVSAAALSAWTACGDNHEIPVDTVPPPQCSDGVDNDGDGQIDYPADLGCDSATDDSEDSLPKPACSDGRDNDGDGKIDYPNDPGCLVPQQDSEDDTCPGAGCPQCADGIDNDNNGHTDYPDDPGCTSAADNDEFVHDPLACGANLMIKQLPSNGTDTGTLGATSTAMLANACGQAGTTSTPAIGYELHLNAPKVVIASTNGTSIDTVIDIRKAPCTGDDSSLACNNDIDGTNHASTVQVSLAAGNYYLLVSGRTTASTGAYILHVNFYSGEGEECVDDTGCGPGLVCRIALGDTTKTCQKHVCEDGVDDDGDGKNDYPDDPGCESLTDDDETDDCPSGPNCPQCGDGVDNDGDTLIDYPADPSCGAASSDSESCQGEQDPIGNITQATTAGTLVGAHDDHMPSCTTATGGPDLLYTLRVPATSTLTIDTNGSAITDTVLSFLSSTCMEPSIECDDDDGDLNLSSITRTNQPAGTYVVAVDAYSSSTTLNTFNLNVHGTLLVNASCEPADTLNGALTCPASNPCGGTMGSRTCRPAACNDGMDNDGDGKTDYPNDPGCSSANDTDETDDCPTGPTCPVCSNGLDDDGDGHTDYPADTNCSSAAGTSESCASSETIVAVTTPTYNGTTVGAANDYVPACGATGATAPDVTLQLDLPALASLDLNLTGLGSFDSVHELLNSTCTGAALSCSDPAAMHLGATAAGTYFLVVDGKTSTQSGAFTLNVSGKIGSGGSCEGALAQSGALTCDTGLTCQGTAGSRTCRGAICNDGIDNDGDGKIDYPNDPGCSTPDDNDESDPCPGAGCPVCADGTDNDADTKIDYAMDLSCWAASGTSEAFCGSLEQDRSILISRQTMAGTTVVGSGLHNDFGTQTCQSMAAGNDLAFAVSLPVPVASIQFDLVDAGTSFDTVLSLRDATCSSASEIACNDDTSTPFSTRSTLVKTNLAAGLYSLILDGYTGGGGGFGTYVLHTHGTVANGTACTDLLFTTGVLSCTSPATCNAGTGTCQ